MDSINDTLISCSTFWRNGQVYTLPLSTCLKGSISLACDVIVETHLIFLLLPYIPVCGAQSSELNKALEMLQDIGDYFHKKSCPFCPSVHMLPSACAYTYTLMHIHTHIVNLKGKCKIIQFIGSKFSSF